MVGSRASHFPNLTGNSFERNACFFFFSTPRLGAKACRCLRQQTFFCFFSCHSFHAKNKERNHESNPCLSATPGAPFASEPKDALVSFNVSLPGSGLEPLEKLSEGVWSYGCPILPQACKAVRPPSMRYYIYTYICRTPRPPTRIAKWVGVTDRFSKMAAQVNVNMD